MSDFSRSIFDGLESLVQARMIRSAAERLSDPLLRAVDLSKRFRELADMGRVQELDAFCAMSELLRSGATVLTQLEADAARWRYVRSAKGKAEVRVDATQENGKPVTCTMVEEAADRFVDAQLGRNPAPGAPGSPRLAARTTLDGPSCRACGSIMRRTGGPCWSCPECGESGGCG